MLEIARSATISPKSPRRRCSSDRWRPRTRANQEGIPRARGRPAKRLVTARHWPSGPASDKAGGSVIGTTPDFAQLVEKLAAHEAIAPMSAAVREAAHAAALARQPKFPLLGDPELAEPEGDPDTAWNTDWGNVWQVLRTGAKSAEQVALVEALLALGDRDQFPSAPESALNTAALVVWLAAHTTCNAFEAFDAALGQGKAAFWQAVGRLVVDPQSGGVDFGQTEALIAAVALRHSASPTAKEVTENLRKELTDPVLLSVLAREPSASQAPELVGELSPDRKSVV